MSLILEDSDMDELRCLLQEKDAEIERLQGLLEVDPGELERLKGIVRELIDALDDGPKMSDSPLAVRAKVKRDSELLKRAKEAVGI